MKKNLIMINPQEFLTEFRNKAKLKDKSVQSEIAKSYHTISNFHSHQCKRNKRRNFISTEHYSTITIEYKNEKEKKKKKEIIVDDLTINDHRRTAHTNYTQSHSNAKKSLINNNLTPLLYSNYKMKRDMLILEVSNLERQKTKLKNRDMSINRITANAAINDKTIELVRNDINRYKKMTDNYKYTFIELSYQINTLKKQLNRVKKVNKLNNE